MSEACVSSQEGMLQFLRFAAYISRRTQCGVSPILVDENIHYRLLKVAWSVPFARWDVPRMLQSTPPLYGVWHAYKYCVVQVARQFHSCMWYCVRGTLLPGAQVATSPVLRTYELILAALLQLPQTVKDDVERMHEQWEALRNDDEAPYQLVATSTSHPQATGDVPGTAAYGCFQVYPPMRHLLKR